MTGNSLTVGWDGADAIDIEMEDYLARLLGVSRQTFSAILHERAGDSGHGAAAGKLCGNGPQLWINLQSRYDLEHVDRRTQAALEHIPTLEPAE